MRRARQYQVDCIRAVHEAYARGVKGVVAELFTGAGKGYIIAAIAKLVQEKGGRVLVTVNRDNLCDQLRDSLIEQKMTPVVERGLDKASPLSNLVVGSIQTMQGDRLKKWMPGHFKLVITDEVHFGASRTFRSVLDYFAIAYQLGLSATIERHDKKGLWQGYEECVFSMPLMDGIHQGWLVPFEFEELPVPIVIEDKLATKRQFTAADEEGVFSKEEYLPRLFREAAARSGNHKSLFFWPNCKSSEEAAKHFESAGIASRHADGYMSKTRLDEIQEWYRQPGPKALHNADLYSYGYDNPSIDLIGIMRLSRSIPMLKQRLGRGTRPLVAVDQWDSPEARRSAIELSDKPRCKVLDLMLQLGDVQNKFATATSLITDDPKEREFIEKQRQSGQSFTMEELESKLKVKRQTDADKALAKLAEDAANAAERAKHKHPRDPYIEHIFTRYPHNGKDASEAAMRYLRNLGFKKDVKLSAQQAFRITEIYKQKSFAIA